MSDSALSTSILDDSESLLPQRRIADEARFDITAMIDLVFMMNIFFLVTTISAALTEIDLPAARHCVAADPETSVVLTIVGNADPGSLRVFIGDGDSSEPLVEREDQDRAVRAAVEEGIRAEKKTVLIKAERNVRLRDLSRIAAIANSIPQVELKVAVLEKE